MTGIGAAIVAAWLVGSEKMTIAEGVITGIVVVLICWIAKQLWPHLFRAIAVLELKTQIIVLVVGVSGLIGIGLIAYPFFTNKHEQLNAKPHIAMTPDLKLIEGQATVMVMFHNRGKEDVDKLTLKILLNDGEKFNENLREVPILRADINRKLFVMIPQDLYNALIAGKEPLKVTASVAYSLHGAPYIESCVLKWNALMRTFDYIDC